MPEIFVFLTVVLFALACRGVLGLCQRLMEAQ